MMVITAVAAGVGVCEAVTSTFVGVTDGVTFGDGLCDGVTTGEPDGDNVGICV